MLSFVYITIDMDFRDIFHSFFGSDHDKHGFSQDFDDFESQINRDFEDIANSFGRMFEIFNRSSIFDDLNDTNRWQQLDIENKSPRDLMIKSDEESTEQKYLDRDLDQRVRRNGLNDLFNKRSDLETNRDHNSFQTKSFTKTYFYSSFDNNQRIEEQITTNDQFGNTETTVTQRIGDQWVTKVIKKNNKNEIIETKEIKNFEGDHNDLNQFGQIKPNGRKEMLFETEIPRNEVIVEPKNGNKFSFLKSFMDFLFK